ncbi:MAG: hypothetical protein JWP85_1640 [Rhodoglobus sp.]|nr:hypothetical protein [Rhodoglobus sp.]
MFTAFWTMSMIGHTAQELGTWEDLGLDVSLTSGQEVVPALASDSVDIGVGSPNRFIGGILAGAELKIVGPASNAWDQYIIVRSDLGIDDLDDWKGGNLGVGTFGSATHYSTVKLAELQGWTEDDYEIVVLGAIDSILAAFDSGVIDGFLWGGSTAFPLEESGKATILGNLGTLIDPMPYNVIAVTDKALAAKPDSIRAFCEGFYEANSQIHEDPDVAADLMISVGGTNPDATPRIAKEGATFLATSPKLEKSAFGLMAEVTALTIEGAEDITGDDVEAMYVPCDSL